MRVLVTRPAEDAAALVAKLSKRGIKSVVEPLLTIELLPGPALDLAGVQALLVTSANGARAFAARAQDRALPVYAVGDASAAAARALGFRAVESAAGDVDALAALVTRHVDPKGGTLLHVAGTDVAGDLGGMLSAAAFRYRREVLYRARPVPSLSPAAVDLFHVKALNGVLLFSPRTAATFVRLARAAALDASLDALHAVCLSPAVAAEVKMLPWGGIAVAARPDTDALIAAVPDRR